MSPEDKGTAEEDNFLSMSDDDFGSLDAGELDAQAMEDSGDTDGDDKDEEESELSDGSGDADEDNPDNDASEDGTDGDDENQNKDSEDDDTDDDEANDEDDGKNDSSDSDDSDDSDADDGDSDGDDTKSDKKPDKPGTASVEHKNFFEQVTSKFRANGKDMQVTSADDVVRLMQQGANYNKKMQGMKPALKTLKILDKNGITQDKLGFLIDLNAKKPEAIAKLLADSDIDPLHFDLDQGSKYKASTHEVDDREINLDHVVEEIKDSPHYDKTVNLVTKEWDNASKQAVADQPDLLKLIDGHMASGVYELISTGVANEQMLGRLTGMSDIEAYSKVGDTIAAAGGFDHLFPAKDSKAPKQDADDDGKTDKKVAESKRRDKRRAASPSKRAAPESKKAKDDFNPLALSDEDFEKQFDSEFV
jgi:hypothetical protein